MSNEEEFERLIKKNPKILDLINKIDTIEDFDPDKEIAINTQFLKRAGDILATDKNSLNKSDFTESFQEMQHQQINLMEKDLENIRLKSAKQYKETIEKAIYNHPLIQEMNINIKKLISVVCEDDYEDNESKRKSITSSLNIMHDDEEEDIEMDEDSPFDYVLNE